MSPRLSRRRRRRALAAPFVITAAVGACTVQSAPPPESPPPTRYDQNGNEVDDPPAGNDQAENGENGEKPRVITNPPAPGTLPDPPKDGNGTLQTRDDGTCWYYVKIDCPPDAKCNPPPPQQVKCETD